LQSTRDAAAARPDKGFTDAVSGYNALRGDDEDEDDGGRPARLKDDDDDDGGRRITDAARLHRTSTSS